MNQIFSHCDNLKKNNVITKDSRILYQFGFCFIA